MDFECALATTGTDALKISFDGIHAEFAFHGPSQSKGTLRATLNSGLNPYFLVFDLDAHQARSGKLYLERAAADYGQGELIDGADSYACQRQ
jgi:hypothetical protein